MRVLMLMFALAVVAGVADAGPSLGGCPMFPVDNVWNAPIDTLPVATESATWMASIGSNTIVRAYFGTDPSYGMPYATAAQGTPLVTVAFSANDEGDYGSYPFWQGMQISYGDGLALVLLQGDCKLYETYDTQYSGGSWTADSGAEYDLHSDALRQDGWVSADAAGLPVLPGLVRYDEVAAGHIDHALRFGNNAVRAAHIWPARHDAGASTDPALPPYGARLRLRADFPEVGLGPQALVIVQALKKYGMFLADRSGSVLWISGASNSHWNVSGLLQAFQAMHASDFEVVDESGLMVTSYSGEARIFANGFEP
ncbi:MAG: hypothetical protein L0H70_05110 [Xanthomonadales bacterium]|nr:hypothetical protein [Xanthomonadales bacterium]